MVKVIKNGDKVSVYFNKENVPKKKIPTMEELFGPEIPPPPPPKRKFVDEISSTDSEEELPRPVKRKKLTVIRNNLKKKVSRIGRKLKKEEEKGMLKPSKENNALYQDRHLKLFLMIMENVDEEGGFRKNFYEPDTQKTFRKLVTDLKYGKYKKLTELYIKKEKVSLKTQFENIQTKKN